MEKEEIQRLIAGVLKDLKAGSKNPGDIQKELVRDAKTIANYRKLNSALFDAIKLNKVLNLSTVKRNALERALNEEYEQNIELLKKNQQIQEDVYKTAKRLAGGLFTLGDASIDGAEKISFYSSALKNVPFVGGAIDELGKSLDYNIGNFRQLASVGADFGQSLVQMRLAARDAVLPLKEFTDFVGTESQLFAGLFGSVNEGTVAVAKLARGIREDLIETFAGLGITTSEYLDYLGTYLDLSRVQGRQETLDRDTVTAGISNYVRSLDQVTKLTGIQRDELNKQVRAQKSDAVLQTFLQRLEPARRQELQTFLAGLQGINPALGSAVSNILATGFPLGDFETNLIGTNGNLMTLIDGLRSGTLDVGQFAQGMSQSADTFLNEFTPQVLRANQNLGAVGNALSDLRRKFGDLDKITRQQTAGGSQLTQQIGVTQEAFRNFKSQVEGLNTSFLQSFGPGLSGFLKIAETGATASAKTLEWMTKNMGSVVGTAVIAAGLGKAFFSYAEQIAIVAAGTAIGTQKGLGGAFKMLTGTVKEMGKYLHILGKAVSVMVGVFQIINDIMKMNSDDPKQQKDGMTGMALGTIAAVLTGILTRSPYMAALAYGAGSMVGNAIGGKVPGLAEGGTIQTGSMALVGERGPELAFANTGGTQILPLTGSNNTASAVMSQNKGMDTARMENLLAQQNSTFKAFSDLMEKSEKHLNMLVGISAKTQKNTETSTRRLANMSQNLV
jgi:hypothetical protein